MNVHLFLSQIRGWSLLKDIYYCGQEEILLNTFLYVSSRFKTNLNDDRRLILPQYLTSEQQQSHWNNWVPEVELNCNRCWIDDWVLGCNISHSFTWLNVGCTSWLTSTADKCVHYSDLYRSIQVIHILNIDLDAT